MVVVQAVELAILAVAVVIEERETERRARFFFPFPLEAPLKSLVHHSARLIFYFEVISKIAPSRGAKNKTEGIGVKFSSAMDKERLLNRIDMPPKTHSSVKPEIFRGFKGRSESKAFARVDEPLDVIKKLIAQVGTEMNILQTMGKSTRGLAEINTQLVVAYPLREGVVNQVAVFLDHPQGIGGEIGVPQPDVAGPQDSHSPPAFIGRPPLQQFDGRTDGPLISVGAILDDNAVVGFPRITDQGFKGKLVWKEIQMLVPRPRQSRQKKGKA